MQDRPKYRVFISYPRKRYAEVFKLVKALEDLDLDPIWDQNLAAGQGFQEQIQQYIAHSHVFCPVITSDASGWVHQEIGYALGLNIPVLPICLDKEPGEMLAHLQALFLGDNQGEKKDRLSWHTFNALVERAKRETTPLYEAAPDHDKRTRMMVTYATRIYEMGRLAIVRQKGALSSFHIPDKSCRDAAWQERYGLLPKSEAHCRILREERLILGRHAEDRGCKLIIDPFLTYEKYGHEARMARLNELLAYLKPRVSDPQVQVAIHENMPAAHSLTIVGDWFVAESVSAELGQGYRQTIFTRHAPTINNRIEFFDEEFDSLLANKGINANESTKYAVDQIASILRDLDCAREFARVIYKRNLRSASDCKQYRKEHPPWKLLSAAEKDLYYQVAANILARLKKQGYQVTQSEEVIKDEEPDLKDFSESQHPGVCPHLFATSQITAGEGRLTDEDITFLVDLLNKEGFELSGR